MELKSKKKTVKTERKFNLQHALAEAERCLLCHDAPCSKGCPAGTDPGKFIRQLRFRNIKGAIRTVRKNNILGGICAEVCPTCKLCVERCSRTGIDRPIMINQIQSFLTNHQHDIKFSVFDKDAVPRSNKKVAVIGSGPAGLACAAELSLNGHEAVVFEKNEKPGGVLTYGIPYVRLSPETLANDIKEVTSLGVKIKCGSKIAGRNAIGDLLKKGYDAVFIACGLSQSNILGIKGSDLAGNYTWSDFLEMSNDPKLRAKAAKLVSGKNVAVIGGGSVAIDAAVSAKKLGAVKVYVISLEGLDELPADSEEIELANRSHIIFKPQCRVTAIKGDGKKVAGLDGVETEWIKKGPLVPSNARDVKGCEFSLKVDAVIHAIGSRVEETAVETLKGAGVKIGDGNRTSVDSSYRTSVKGVFAGGDMIASGRKINTVAAAVYDGKTAAAAIHNYLTSNKKGGIK